MEEADRLLQLYMSSLTHYYKTHKSIYVMKEDPAWDEYMSTGIDPTGGKLGPDFNTESGEYYEEQETYINPEDLQ